MTGFGVGVCDFYDALFGVSSIMWQFSQDDVIDRLKKVIDPELFVNIVDLGLIYSVELTQQRVMIRMTLTSPGCPLAPVIHMMVTESLEGLPGFSRDALLIDLTFDPPWVPDMMTEEAKALLGMD